MLLAGGAAAGRTYMSRGKHRALITLTAALLWVVIAAVGCGGSDNSGNTGSSGSSGVSPGPTTTSGPQAPANSPTQAPSSPPPTSTPKTLPKLPPADSGTGQVTGGGPGGDPAATMRLSEQFPTVPGDITVDGDRALKYLKLLRFVFPELKTELSVFETGIGCAQRYGVADFKIYVTPDFRAAGVVAVVSHNQSQQLPTIALRCLTAPVTGGGPLPPNSSTAFQPCFTDFSIQDSAGGVLDTYYIFAAGTNQDWCQFLTQQVYRQFNEQPLPPL
jgi:hypothetical protein